MNDLTIYVRPVSGGGWRVGANANLEPAYFRSGARAEVAARTLAVRMAKAGAPVQLEVSDLRETIVAIQVYAMGDAPRAVFR